MVSWDEKAPNCLVPADGTYEWLGIGEEKQPYCYLRTAMLLAGSRAVVTAVIW